jgi:hypothetical protein
MTVEVRRPLRPVLAATEPLVGKARQRAEHVGLHASVPRDDLGRRPSAPALPDEPVDRAHVEAAQLRRPALAPEHARAVLLPVHDVGERVLDRPRLAP